MIVETVRSAFPASLPRLLGVAVCSVFALGTGNNVIVMFAIAPASANLLTTVGMIVPMDSFAPVTGSALGTKRCPATRRTVPPGRGLGSFLYPQPLLSVRAARSARRSRR
jgi:Na+/H+-translocating membrane pyrophosphatase